MSNKIFIGDRPDFTSAEYLRNGNPVQRKCAQILTYTGIMELLAPFGPVVAGTIPIGIDIPGSDIDILCRAGGEDGEDGECTGFARLEKLLTGRYGTGEGFRCYRTVQRGPVGSCLFVPCLRGGNRGVR